MPSSYGRSIAATVFVFVLTFSPYAHAAETAAVTINDPFTDAIQLWGEVLTSLNSFAHDLAAGFASPQTLTDTSPQKLHVQNTLTPPPLAAAAALATEVVSKNAAPAAGSADTSIAPQKPQSRSPPKVASIPMTITPPAPAESARAFVTQEQFDAALSVLGSSVRQLLAAQTFNAAASPPLGGGSSNTIAAANAINNLSNVTISNPTFQGGISGLSASDIPSLDYLPLSGGTLTGNLLVDGTSTLVGITLSSANCSTYGNGGKLTTDGFGNVICAADQGGAGSTVAGSDAQVQFNSGGAFAASSAFTFSSSTDKLAVTNASTSALTATYASTSNLIASNSFTLGSLSGFLKATAGAVSTSLINLGGDVTGVLPIVNGGTGTSTAPSNGQVLLGNAAGGYNLVSTSSLGIVSAAWGSITGTLANQTDLQNALNAKFSLSDWYATTTNALKEGSTNLYFTNARAQSAISILGTPLTYSSGVIGINQANGSQAGYLSSSDWTNFNNKIASTSLSASEPITYNSSTGAIALDLTHANFWAGLQQITNASSSLFSAYGPAYFGGSATSSFNSSGALALVSNGLTVGGGQLVVSGGNLGLGTTSPGSILSINGVTNFTTATSSFYGTGGINLTSGCFAVGGTCLSTSGGGVSLSVANTWSALQTFSANASSTQLSAYRAYFGGSATSSFATNGSLSLVSNGLTVGTNQFTVSGGNVGIGTSSPYALLSVSGGDTRLKETTNSATALVVENAAGTSTLQVSTVDSSQNIFEIASSTGTAFLDVTSGGNIGVGSTTPAATFGVVGSQYLTGGLGVGVSNSTAGTLQTSGNILAGGNVGIGTTTPYSNLTVWGANTTSGVQSFLVANSASTTEFAVDNAGNAYLAGNFGIGTTSPASIFSVQGVANWTGATTTYYATGGINLTSGCFSINGTCITGGGGGSGTVSSGTTGQFPYYASNSTTLTATSSIFLASSSNVGIGTTTPGSLLSLNNIANFTAATSTFYSTGGINVVGGCFSINGNCIGNSIAGNAAGSSGQVQFNNGGTAFGASSNLFWDTANNRLGIGTSSPYAELSVATPNGASGSVTTLFAISSSTQGATSTQTF